MNEQGEIICEDECPACGEMLPIYKMGVTKCSCGGAKAIITVNWELIEEKEDE